MKPTMKTLLAVLNRPGFVGGSVLHCFSRHPLSIEQRVTVTTSHHPIPNHRQP